MIPSKVLFNSESSFNNATRVLIVSSENQNICYCETAHVMITNVNGEMQTIFGCINRKLQCQRLAALSLNKLYVIERIRPYESCTNESVSEVYSNMAYIGDYFSAKVGRHVST